MKKFLSKKKGFTLIELIVVIAILAILAAILVPSMLGVIGNANDNTDKANARSVYSSAVAACANLQVKGTAITKDSVEAETLIILGSGFKQEQFAVTLNAGGDGVQSILYHGHKDVTYPGGTLQPTT